MKNIRYGVAKREVKANLPALLNGLESAQTIRSMFEQLVDEGKITCSYPAFTRQVNILVKPGLSSQVNNKAKSTKNNPASISLPATTGSGSKHAVAAKKSSTAKTDSASHETVADRLNKLKTGKNKSEGSDPSSSFFRLTGMEEEY